MLPAMGSLCSDFPGCRTASRGFGRRPYKVSKVVKIGGEGRFDTAFADVAGRRLYIPRKDPGWITVFNLDTLEPAGEIR